MKQGEPMWIAGCMSGTSLDGVDVAMILTDGVKVHDFGASAYRPYSEAERAILRSALGAWQDDEGVQQAAKVVEDAHLAVLSDLSGFKMIGFHGQTLAHDPANKRTHQAGGGARLAQKTGLPVAWDFRSNDVALGGQGAPLAPVFHAALVAQSDVIGPVAVLNLGGVGNISYVDPANPEALLAFDTGPANAPLDDFMQKRRSLRFDEDAALARSGKVNDAVIQQLLAKPYFNAPAPKSLDRDDFAFLGNVVATLSDADGAATLTRAMAAPVVQGFELLPNMPTQLWVTGGGRHNPLVMAYLAENLDCAVVPIEDAGFDGDMLEAQAFAFLAARVANGLPTSFPGTTGVAMAVGGGVISRPAP